MSNREIEDGFGCRGLLPTKHERQAEILRQQESRDAFNKGRAAQAQEDIETMRRFFADEFENVLDELARRMR